MKRSFIISFWKQRGLCYYCEVNLIDIDSSQISKDHVIPKSKGGKEIVVSCSTCNQLKKDYSEKNFYEWISNNKQSIQDYNLTLYKRDE